jgi:hypothetical protein
VLVKLREARDSGHDVGALVHDNHSASAKTGLGILQGVVIHAIESVSVTRQREDAGLQDFRANVFGDNRDRRSSGDDTQQVVPSTDDATTVLLNEILQRDTHLFLDHAGVIHMSADTVELGSLVPVATEASKPAGASSADSGRDSDGFDVRYCCWAAEKANVGREGGLEAGLSLFPFYTLDEGGFFTANVGTGAAVYVDVEPITRSTGVLAEETGSISLVDSLLDMRGFLVELSTDIDVGGSRIHGASSDEAAFDEFMGIAAKNFTILASTGFTFVGINDEIAWPGVASSVKGKAKDMERRTEGPFPIQVCS